MSKTVKAHLALIVANLFFGINYPVAKSLMPDFFQPMEIIILRISCSIILFWVFQYLFLYEKTERKDLFKFALCGLFGVSINQVLFFEGLNLSTPIDASIIMVSNPILVLLIASFAKNEKLSWIKVTGIILGSAGALVTIIYGKNHTSGTNPFLGNILLFANALSYAVYLVMIKPLMAKYNSFTVMKWTFLFGGLFVIPFTPGAFTSTNWETFNVFSWSAIVYVLIASTFLAYLLIAYSMKVVNASVASFYIFFQPVIASVLSMVIYQEKLQAIKIFAALMIFAGVYLVSKKNQLKQMPERNE